MIASSLGIFGLHVEVVEKRFRCHYLRTNIASGRYDLARFRQSVWIGHVLTIPCQQYIRSYDSGGGNMERIGCLVLWNGMAGN